jgi:hypothetical protein
MRSLVFSQLLADHLQQDSQTMTLTNVGGPSSDGVINPNSCIPA